MANTAPKPGRTSRRTAFSSGPCAKRPGWSLAALEGALLGRSHRAKEPKARLAEVIERSRSVLGMPADWRLGIVPASDTGAVEMALWSMLGARGVDVLVWEILLQGMGDRYRQALRLQDVRLFEAPYGRRRTSRRPTRHATWCSCGTAPPPGRAAAGWRTSSPPTARALAICDGDLGRLRHGPAQGQVDGRHLVLAEGAGRRGGARDARAVAARGGAAGILQAPTAAPKIFRMTKGGG